MEFHSHQIGGNEEPEMIEQLGKISEECHEWNVPLLAMMYPEERIKDHMIQKLLHIQPELVQSVGRY